jgi:chromosome segregation ATPase
MALTGMLPQRDGWQNQAAHLSRTQAAVVVPEHMRGGRSTQRPRSRSEIVAAEIERGTETRNFDYANELETMRARVLELQEQVARKTAAARIVDAHMKTLSAQAASAQQRITDLEIELGSTQEALARQENENCSLQSSLDLMVAENARLSRRLLEECTTCDTVSSRLERVNVTLTATDAEREKLIAAAAEADKKHQSETSELEFRLKTLASRAAAAEALLAEVQKTLREQTEEKSLAERKAVGATLARNLAENEVKSLQAALRAKDREVLELQQSRSKLMLGLNSLLENFKNREAALAAAKERIRVLGERLATAEAGFAKRQAKIDELKFLPESGFTSRAVAAGGPMSAQALGDEWGRQPDGRAGSTKSPARALPQSAEMLLAETVTF